MTGDPVGAGGQRSSALPAPSPADPIDMDELIETIDRVGRAARERPT
jgi:hypothetical protein